MAAPAAFPSMADFPAGLLHGAEVCLLVAAAIFSPGGAHYGLVPFSSTSDLEAAQGSKIRLGRTFE